MKKSIFNSTALKKASNKKALLFNYSEDNDVIIWNESGTFVIKCNKLLFEYEILNSLPTEQKEIPTCIPATFATFENSSVLSETFLYLELNNIIVKLYQNYKYKYLTPVNTELLKILNNLTNFTPYQAKQNSPLLFKNDFISVLIMPVYNGGIKEKIQTIAEELKQ